MLFFDMTKLGTIDLSSTSAEKRFFGDLPMWKSNFSLHLSKGLNFRHTSKKFKEGSPKKILEKKNVFPKKYVELRTFDGMSDIFERLLIKRFQFPVYPMESIPPAYVARDGIF